MGPTRLSLRNRLLLLQEEFRDKIVGVTFFCALVLMAAIPFLTRPNSPIVDTQRVKGVVQSTRTTPINPKLSIGRGFRYRYEIRLYDRDAPVFVDGEVGRPHMIGSEVSIERQHRETGTETYQLLNE
ncbi:MAG: hypothetical protein EOS85_13125 [Mesorhizobium sp.]|nr:hypothetical protein EJ075_15115 [Mesorhizobium sp. M6A.T.Cr.TU.016.01.1.1]RWP50994.1 MAG: hypothetical protein EOR06_22800 [Mesorhizobium sp.]RWQ82589.1 MAG: hypothetical protein EOS85_13125 [Mesorhizobium sp.]